MKYGNCAGCWRNSCYFIIWNENGNKMMQVFNLLGQQSSLFCRILNQNNVFDDKKFGCSFLKKEVLYCKVYIIVTKSLTYFNMTKYFSGILRLVTIQTVWFEYLKFVWSDLKRYIGEKQRILFLQNIADN